MLAVAKAALLLLVFSLPFAKPALAIGGLDATATDLLFLIAAAALTAAIVTGKATLRWSRWFVILAAYLAVMLASVLAVGSLAEAAPRLAAQLYLLSLPVLVVALIDGRDDLRRLFRAWLAGTAACAAIGVGALTLFAAGVDRAAIDFALHGFGTLPPGAFARLEATFTHPAMLCNYLTVSLMILLISLRLRWIGRVAGYALLGAILLTAAFTITPGLGGIALLLGVWLFLETEERARLVASSGLALGGALAVAFVAVSAVTPILHPTAPFLIHLPGDVTLAPSVRLIAWIEAGRSILDQPVFGAGFAADQIAVDYVAPSGERHVLSDAHNVYLNVAMNAGLISLAAVVALVIAVARAMRPLRLTDGSAIRLGLGFAWLNAFAYQGLTGSYEDARHLWLLLGLLMATVRLDRVGGSRV